MIQLGTNGLLPGPIFSFLKSLRKILNSLQVVPYCIRFKSDKEEERA